MARITGDLIDLLTGRNFTNFFDFPNMAQAKLINRRALQSNMSALTNLVSDEENTFLSAIRRDPDRPQAAGEEQTKCRSPKTWSIRLIGDQYLSRRLATG